MAQNETPVQTITVQVNLNGISRPWVGTVAELAPMLEMLIGMGGTYQVTQTP